MALCPFAVHELMPYNDNLPTREHANTLILHTNGGPTGPHGDLHDYFARKGNDVCSHFQVANDGTLYQYVDTDREAYAQYAGNAYGVSVETEDDGNPSRPWTQAQINTIVKVARWLEVPARVSSDGNGGGVGWHSLYSDWNQSSHNCPGSERTSQIHSAVLPALDSPEPHPHPTPAPTPPWYRRVLSVQNPELTGSDVKVVQDKVRAYADGVYGPKTKANVEAYQRAHHITVDGVVGPATAKVMGP
jgi:peptidoglycan hydrolase-like protein with peptidoglycan-binding domain